MTTCDVAIIGAGPYGLSVAAHLRARGVNFRIFGKPMEFWLKHMPQGMRLKSEGFASSIYDPGATFTLEAYCREHRLPYAPIGSPVPIEAFSSYGLEFQKKFVPELECHSVLQVRRLSAGFEIVLSGGETLTARRVVVAVGLTYYDYLPPELAGLPSDLVTHSSRHSSLDHFKGEEVVVVGAGASALDLAALLHQAGVLVRLVARKPSISFHDRGRVPRPLLEQLRNPTTGIGPGWRSFFYTRTPLLFRQMPEPLRLKIVRQHLGPAPAWFVKDQVVGKVPFNLGVTITHAEEQDKKVSLRLTDADGLHQTLLADHVIAATGYKVDVDRLSFLDPDILRAICRVDRAPALSSHFESSVQGLYFVGISAANTFGPLLRFAVGSKFTAERLSTHLARASRAMRREVHAPEAQMLADQNI